MKAGFFLFTPAYAMFLNIDHKRSWSRSGFSRVRGSLG
ncbi:hypothetical protein CFELI_04510 [Corynebacterium felinum]|uniref:Transposase n=1 Tax=Corynebacterium felinum TaxID=131318 RepID=A0ABU2BA73_9CORY|nr:hypothetical protein [Corynebacterium felinum]WJY94532.1 hypothetical protein CFELI_04510 [Corynebacterium felinum]